MNASGRALSAFSTGNRGLFGQVERLAEVTHHPLDELEALGFVASA
jgi:hypothetical protein